MFKYPIILIALTFITYLNILPNQLFFDDEELIYKNAYVQNIMYLPRFFSENMIAGAGKISNMYRPILMTTFAFDHFFWGNNPFGYHLTSIFLHGANGVLVFYLINLLFRRRLLALLTSILFVIHPFQSETVIYASGRTDPLYSLFALLSLIFFVKGKSITVIIFFILSLLSKESAIILPLTYLIIYLIFKRGKNVFPTFLITGVYIYLRLTIFNFSNSLNFYQTGNIYSQNLSVRFYTFTKVFFEYLTLLFYPMELSIARSTSVITSIINPFVLLFVILFIVGLFLSLKFYKKDPLYFFAFSWFFITILPVSGIIPINNIVAEHYLYLPSLSFFLVCAKILDTFSRKRILFTVFITVLFSALINRTIIRTFDWRDPITFYTKSLKQSPWHIPMHNNLAMAYAEQGRSDEAIQEYQKTIQLGDVYPNLHHNLANTYKEQGKYQEAEREYKKALDMDPNFYFSYFGLADLYQKTGEKEKLEEILNKLK